MTPTDDAYCIHEFPLSQCGLCRPRKQQLASGTDQVWVLPTSEVYHRRDCYVFDAQTASNLAQGRKDSEPMPLTFPEAEGRSLRRCAFCSPHRR